MKKWMHMLVCGVVVLLGACAQQEAGQETEIKAIEVEIEVPSHGSVNEEIPIQAKVMYGKELVEDAEVTFEFANGDEKEEVKAENEGKGVYRVVRVFMQQGTYEIIAHTNAKDMHAMPKKTIEIK